MWKNNLKTKLAISFTLIGFVALAVAGASLMVGMKRAIEQEIKDELMLLTDAKEGQVYAYLDKLESSMGYFMLDDFILNSVKEINYGNSKKTEILNKYLINGENFLDTSLAGTFIVDLNDKVIASTEEDEIGEDESADEYISEGKKGIFSIELLGHEHFGLENAFIVSAPLKDKNADELLGVIVNVFDIQKLESILSGQFQLEKGAKTSFVNNDFNKTLTINLVNKEKKLMINTSEREKNGIRTVNTLPVQKCINEKEEIYGTYINYLGEKVLGASTCFLNKGWTLTTEIKTKDAFASVTNAIEELTVMLILTLIIMTLNILFVSGNIVKPIQELHKAANIMAKGNLDYKVDIRTNDEIQQLGEAFNEMAINLKNSHNKLQEYSIDLEEKITEKTKDLQSKLDDLSKAREAILNVAEDAELEKNKAEGLSKDLEKFKLAVDDVSDHIVITDKEGIVIYGNKAVKKITGYDPKEALGKKAGVLWRLPMPKEYYEKMWDIIKNKKQIFIGELTNVRKSGKQYEAYISISPVLDKNGEILYFVGMERDISKEKEVNRAKTEFVSLASHQLRTPLSGIKWDLETLLNGYVGDFNENQKSHLEDIYKSNQRMIDIVNALLNVSRLELGTLFVEAKPCDIRIVVDEVIKELKKQLEEKQINFSKNYEEFFLKKINLDKKLMHIIIENLLTNAIKYTKKGGKIELEIIKQDSDFLIKINDNGIGIPAIQQEKMFTKIFRADNAMASDTEGNGLGLYMTKLIVEQIGGKIWFESEENKGSVFYVRMPLKGMKK